jgi:hypothetical protein
VSGEPRYDRSRPTGSPDPAESARLDVERLDVERHSVHELAAQTAEASSAAGRSKGLALMTRGLTTSARGAGVRAVGGGRWLADEMVQLAPHIRFRDLKTLRTHHPGRTDEEIAQTLVRHAARTTAAIGAAAGVLASVEYAAPPTLLAAPVQLAAETLAVAAVELKLVAELHELTGQPARGSLVDRASLYLMSWTRQRAIDPTLPNSGLAAALGQTAKRELRIRLMRRLSRNLTSLAPLLAGAAAGAEINRRATRTLGDKLLAELRGRRGR